jgi:hypothetical protein
LSIARLPQDLQEARNGFAPEAGGGRSWRTGSCGRPGRASGPAAPSRPSLRGAFRS